MMMMMMMVMMCDSQLKSPGLVTMADGKNRTLYMSTVQSIETATKPNLKKTLQGTIPYRTTLASTTCVSCLLIFVDTVKPNKVKSLNIFCLFRETCFTIFLWLASSHFVLCQHLSEIDFLKFSSSCFKASLFVSAKCRSAVVDLSFSFSLIHFSTITS